MIALALGLRRSGGPEEPFRATIKGARGAEIARLVIGQPRHGRGLRSETAIATATLSAAVKVLAHDQRLDCLATAPDFIKLAVSARFATRAAEARHPAEPFHELAREALGQTLQPQLRAALRDHFRWMLVGATFAVNDAGALPLVYLIDLMPRMQLKIAGRALNAHAPRRLASVPERGTETRAALAVEAVKSDLASEVSAVVHPMRGLLARLAPDRDEPALALCVDYAGA